jgi:hypothetical protein
MKVTGAWRKLHYAVVHNLYSSHYITRLVKSRRMSKVSHVACRGEVRNAYRILVRNQEGKKLLQRPMHRWKEHIKIE